MKKTQWHVLLDSSIPYRLLCTYKYWQVDGQTGAYLQSRAVMQGSEQTGVPKVERVTLAAQATQTLSTAKQLQSTSHRHP